MASFYREQVAQLHEALHDDTESSRLRASEAIRSLVDKIVLTPTDGEIAIEVHGALAGILNVATQRDGDYRRSVGPQGDANWPVGGAS